MQLKLTGAILVAFVLISLVVYVVLQLFINVPLQPRVAALNEYVRRMGAETPAPETLGFVSRVNGHHYDVDYFNTNTMQLEKRRVALDDRVETFDFLGQRFVTNEKWDTSWTSTPIGRLKPHHERADQYLLLAEDSWVTMTCPTDHLFDPSINRCVEVSPCHGHEPNTSIPLDENRLNSLIFESTRLRHAPADASTPYHPTLYVHCLREGDRMVHEVRQCPERHVFDSETGRCVYRSECTSRPDGYVLDYRPAGINVNQYMECREGQMVVATCPDRQVFDTMLQRCTDSHPCALHGAGYTYLEENMPDNQYILCESNHLTRVVTCVRRDHDGEVYSCGGDEECADLDTGVLVKQATNDHLYFATGLIECQNYDVVRRVTCDVDEETFDRVRFDGRFQVPDLSLPKEVYDATSGQCLSFEEGMRWHAAWTLRPFFTVQAHTPSQYDVPFETAMRGEVARATAGALQNGTLQEVIVYSKDDGHVAVNAEDGNAYDCYNGNTYDVFDGKRLNICDEQSDLVRQVQLAPNQYIGVRDKSIREDADWAGEMCRERDMTVASDRHLIQYGTSGSYECETFLSVLNKSQSQKFHLKTKPGDEAFADLHSGRDPTLRNKPLGDVQSDQASDQLLIKDISSFIGGRDATISLSCFYSIPTYKLTECLIDPTARRITTDFLCTMAENLGNIINAVAILDFRTGCRSVLALAMGTSEPETDSDSGWGPDVPVPPAPPQIHVHIQAFDPGALTPFYNYDTQSVDGHVYNEFIHKDNFGRWHACPPDLWNGNDCTVPLDQLWFLTDLQE